MKKDGLEISLPSMTPVTYQTLNEELFDQKSYQDLETQQYSLRHESFPNITEKRYFGNNYVFLWRNKEPIFTLGPHWYLFVPTWVVLEALGIFLYFQLAAGASDSVKRWTIGLIIWEGFIYMLTALLNPGIVTNKNPDDPNIANFADNHNFCAKCKILRDKSTHHCWDCNVCIKGFDHHCPWTGKCIGRGNLIPFYAFFLTTAGYLVFFMMLAFRDLK